MANNIYINLLNKIKTAFSATPGTLVFISLKATNIDELTPIIFTLDTCEECSQISSEHFNKKIPYAAFNRLDENSYSFYFCCEEFERADDCLTGKTLHFRKNPHQDLDIDIEKIKKDLKKLGQILAADSEAS